MWWVLFWACQAGLGLNWAFSWMGKLHGTSICRKVMEHERAVVYAGLGKLGKKLAWEAVRRDGGLLS